MKQLTPFITERDGIPVTTSRAVAEQFGKRHDVVLRAIDELLSELDPVSNDRKIVAVDGDSEQTEPALISPGNADFAAQNFLLTEYKDGKGELRPEYLLTRDGFTLLAMGFTGAKALTFKVAYINAFNRMEQLIKGGVSVATLQNLEERLQALERTAGEGKPDAMHKVGQIYLSALKKAIESGKYTIEKRYARHDEPKKILGLEDRGYIAVKTVLSYRIYSAYAKKPLTRLALWGVLEQAGCILPKGKFSPAVKICGNKYAVVYVPADKLIDGAEEAENGTE